MVSTEQIYPKNVFFGPRLSSQSETYSQLTDFNCTLLRTKLLARILRNCYLLWWIIKKLCQKPFGNIIQTIWCDLKGIGLKLMCRKLYWLSVHYFPIGDQLDSEEAFFLVCAWIILAWIQKILVLPRNNLENGTELTCQTWPWSSSLIKPCDVIVYQKMHRRFLTGWWEHKERCRYLSEWIFVQISDRDTNPSKSM